MAAIGFMLIIEIISHVGMLFYMGIMQKSDKLTERFFALVQVGYFNLYMLTGFLLTPPTLKVIMVLVIITITLWALGYPFARWLYRQMFTSR